MADKSDRALVFQPFTLSSVQRVNRINCCGKEERR